MISNNVITFCEKEKLFLKVISQKPKTGNQNVLNIIDAKVWRWKVEGGLSYNFSETRNEFTQKWKLSA